MNENQKKGYGVFSLMAMIIGIVIGSGIFAKNAGLIAINGSILDTMLAWLVGGILVIAILIAFLEIISITEITNEQATMANWGRHLLGKRFGSFVGYYMVLVYFPMVMAGLFIFASNQFNETLVAADINIFSGLSGSPALQQGVTQITFIAIACVAIAILFVMNSQTTKPGRLLQNIGTSIKTIPLFFLVILLVVLFAKGDVTLPSHQTIVDNINKGVDPAEKTSHWALILMTLPGILFSVDGFLLAGSLSKESKKPSSFKTAFVISIIFILIIYISYSFATLALGDPTQAGYGSISNAIFTVFHDNASLAKGLAITTNAIITLSMLVGISGCIIACMRMYSDLSVHNSITDPNFNSITKNKNGVAVMSGFWVGANVIFWLIVATTFDITGLALSKGTVTTTGAMKITGYMTDLIVVGMFLQYAIVIIGGIINRFTNKVETKKNAFFLPAAILAAIMTLAITSYFGYLIIWPDIHSVGDVIGHDGTTDIIATKDEVFNEWVAWGMVLVFTIIYVAYSFGSFFYFSKKTSTLTEEFKQEKEIASKTYYGELDYISSDELLDNAFNTIQVMRAERKAAK